MAYFYIKNDGTAANDEGRYAIQQTGSFATLGTANYYNSIQATTLATTPPTLGDYVCISNVNPDDAGVPNVQVLLVDTVYISVDDTDITTYLPGAKCGTYNSFQQYHLSYGTVYMFGITITAQLYIGLTIDYGTLNLHDSTLNSAYCRISGNGGGVLKGKNINIDPLDTGFSFLIYNASKISLNSGSISGDVVTLVKPGGSNGSKLDCINFDLSNVTGTLVESVPYSDSSVVVNLLRNLLNPALAYTTTILPTAASIINASSCNNSTNYDTYEYFRNVTRTGETLESSIVYRNNGATYDEINGFSVEYQPNINVIENVEALSAELGIYEIDLRTGAIVDIHFILDDQTSIPAALNDTECWLELIYPDETNITLGKTLYSKPDLFGTPSVLPASTEEWNGIGVNTRKQKISVSIPAVNLISAAISIRLHLAKNITQTTNEMFVCPSIVRSI